MMRPHLLHSLPAAVARGCSIVFFLFLDTGLFPCWNTWCNASSSWFFCADVENELAGMAWEFILGIRLFSRPFD